MYYCRIRVPPHTSLTPKKKKKIETSHRKPTGRLTKLRKLLEPNQGMTPKQLPIRRRKRADLIRAGEGEGALCRFGGLPFLAVLGHEQAKLVCVVDDLHVGRVIKVARVRGRAKEQLAGGHGETVQPLFWRLLASVVLCAWW